MSTRVLSIWRQCACFEDTGNQENATWSLSHQADLFRKQGDDRQARELYQQALAKFRGLRISHGIASCLEDLASLAAAAGDPGEARRLYKECLMLYGPENREGLPRILEAFAGLALQVQAPEHALTLAGSAAATRERYSLRTSSRLRRAEVEQKTDKARKQAGPAAAASWMKGWNMSREEAFECALEDRGDEMENFVRKLRGRAILPGDQEYEATRHVYNADIDRRPRVIVQCAGVAGVIHCVNYAREQKLALAVRGGGHSAPGFGTCDDGVVADLCRMKSIRIDPEERVARVEGGCIWAMWMRQRTFLGLRHQAALSLQPALAD